MNNDFEKQIKNIMVNLRKERESEHYTLGMLIDALSNIPQDYIVNIEPFDLIPTGFSSYRGYYEDVAMEFDCSRDACTVETLRKWAESTVGKQLCGYKGGDFLMTRNTPVWISNYGKASQIRLSKVEVPFEGYVSLYGEKVED